MTARILVVEDEGLVARDIAATLEEMEYTVVGITDTGEAAVERAIQEKPDLILMDIRLAGRLDGIDAAQRIRETVDIPVVFLTAHSDEATVRRATETQPFGYIVKPFEASDLRVVIEVTLHRHESDRALRHQEALMRVLLATVDTGVMGIDEKHKVVFMNTRAEAITGWDIERAGGRDIGEVLDLRVPGSDEAVDTIVESAFRDGREQWSMGAVWARSGHLTLVDGVVATVPAPTPEGEKLGVISLADRTSTARIEELVEERNRLRAELRRRR